MTTIQGKVAELISPHEIAINRGASHGVQQGDTARVHRRVEVTDPDSGEAIGSVLVRVVSIELFIVQEKMAVGRITDRVPSQGASLFRSTSRLPLMPPLKRATADPRKVDDQTVYVAIGQMVTINRDDDKAEA